MSEQSEKVRENRLRRMAQRQGLRLMKSRRRDPRAVDYGSYWLLDASLNVSVIGEANAGLALNEVEEYLTRALLDGLEKHGERLILKVVGDEITSTVGGKPVDVEVIAHAVDLAETPTWAPDLVDVYLAPEPDLRIYVARVPAFAGTEVTITVAIAALMMPDGGASHGWLTQDG